MLDNSRNSLTVVESPDLGSLSRAWYSIGMSEYSVINPKYPNINIPLVGEDGNAFSILGRVHRIMRNSGIANEWDEFHAEATSGDYDNLLRTVMTWFAHDQNLPDDYEEYEDADDTCDSCGEDYWDCECE